MLSANGSLSGERVATGGANISLTDAGAGGALTVAVDPQGTGSGLDADTVDGVQLSGLVQTGRAINTAPGLLGGGDLSANRTLSLDIAGLTEEATPDGGDMVAIFDDSAGGMRKQRRDFFLSGTAAAPQAQFNPIINGGMRIAQHGTSFPAVASGDYTLDMFKYEKSGAMVHTVSQSTDVPTVAQAGRLLSYSLLVDCTTIDGSIGPGDQAGILHIIEGFNWSKFAGQPFWFSFWVKATKPGVYCAAFHGAASFVAEYTVNAANTWEFKEILVDASPLTGSWNYGNGAGLNIRWMLAAGAGFQIAAGAWQSGAFYASPNQVNACDSTANDWQIAGIMMSKDRSPFWQPDYGVELGRAQRYYFAESSNFYPFGFAAATSTTGARIFIPSPVGMRDVPTATGIDLLRGNGASVNTTGVTPVGVRSAGILLTCTVASGLVANNMYAPMSSSGGMAFSAEL